MSSAATKLNSFVFSTTGMPSGSHDFRAGNYSEELGYFLFSSKRDNYLYKSTDGVNWETISASFSGKNYGEFYVLFSLTT